MGTEEELQRLSVPALRVSKSIVLLFLFSRSVVSDSAAPWTAAR